MEHETRVSIIGSEHRGPSRVSTEYWLNIDDHMSSGEPPQFSGCSPKERGQLKSRTCKVEAEGPFLRQALISL